jgi:hypothetical protein
MPKISCCDVCYYQRDEHPLPGKPKLTESKWTISRKNNIKKISLHTCEEHKDFFKDCKTIEETELKVSKLYSGG